MAKRLLRKRIIKGVRWLRCRRGHGVHSPFAFHLITRVIEEQCSYYCYDEIALVRKELLTQGGVTRNKLITQKLGKLLFRLVYHFKPSTIIEVGTSWGISTLYLQRGERQAQLYCIESDPLRLSYAKEQARREEATIEFITESVESSLPSVVETNVEGELFLLLHNTPQSLTTDTLQQLLPLIAHRGIVVVEGIKKSDTQRTLWQTLKTSPEVQVTMDLYEVGIAICNPKLNKQDYIVAF